jgi:hypothetical protein
MAITSYSMYHIPALLQSADYARAIIKGIEVEARLHRQLLLDKTRTPPRATGPCSTRPCCAGRSAV